MNISRAENITYNKTKPNFIFFYGLVLNLTNSMLFILFVWLCVPLKLLFKSFYIYDNFCKTNHNIWIFARSFQVRLLSMLELDLDNNAFDYALLTIPI